MAMSLKAMSLDPLYLSSSSGELSLSLTSTIHFKFSSTLHTSQLLHDIDALQLILSGALFITTGAECCIEIYLTLDGQEPMDPYREYINEIVTKYFRDGVPWPQLSLSASIIASQKPCSGHPSMKLNLSHTLPSSSADAKLAALLKTGVDFRAPNGVLSAETNLFELRFNIRRTSRTGLQHKKLKTHANDNSDLCEDEAQNIAKNDLGLNDAEVTSYLQHTTIGGSISLPTTHDGIKPVSTEIDFIRQNLPRSEDNYHVAASMEKPVSHDMSQAILRPKVQSTPFDVNLSLPNLEVPVHFSSEDDEMLLEEPESMILFPSPSHPSQHHSLKRSSSDGLESRAEGSVNQELKSLNFLVDNAFRIAVGGYGPGCKGMSNSLVMKPRPSIALCRIVPNLWSPEFKQLMNQNARFIPSISRSMVLSWRTNAQSPTLRWKLGQLEKEPTSIFSHNAETSMESLSAGNLESTIQTRLWTMMQQKLCDPLSARRVLARYSGSSRSSDESSLTTMKQDHGFTSSQSSLASDSLAYYILGVNELMMLEDLEEVESQTVEQDAEDMLLSEFDSTDVFCNDGKLYTKDNVSTPLLGRSTDGFSDRNACLNTLNSDLSCFSSAPCLLKDENVSVKSMSQETSQNNHGDMLLGSDCSNTYDNFLEPLRDQVERQLEDLDFMPINADRLMASENMPGSQLKGELEPAAEMRCNVRSSPRPCFATGSDTLPWEMRRTAKLGYKGPRLEGIETSTEIQQSEMLL
ncbi:hypothetical protein PVAG01_06988 [Phlyctema vagabunda]|uniref:Uncharacterized protein n=1 Tax=Phlyctema vagabunda TaxID=108571 RepID=A0ABR4PB49_9HELO